MCWESNKLKKLVSDGTVKIFKICKTTLKFNKNIVNSYYFEDFCYALNTEYHTKINIQSMWDYPLFRGYNGFHSYLKKKCKTERYSNDIRIFIPRVWPKFDAYKDFPTKKIIETYSAFFCDPLGLSTVVVDGYIPKGATYYINENYEIISDGMVLTNIKLI